MSNGENRTNGPQFRTAPLITSAVMVGAGTLIALVGLRRTLFPDAPAPTFGGVAQ